MDSQLATPQLSLNFTRLSKAVVALLSVGYIVPLLVPFARQYLALVPGRCVTDGSDQCIPVVTTILSTPSSCRTIPCVWNIFTAGLVEKDIFRVCVKLLKHANTKLALHLRFTMFAAAV